jgi:GT2 family glycosyltransferase
MTDISIIVVNLNTRELLQACLESVYADGSAVSSEVIVIDNGSSDGSVDLVKERFPHVRLVTNRTNEGFARPNNVGMQMAKGRHVFLLNSDASLHPGTLGRLCEFLDSHPEAGACGPRLVYPDGRLQRSVKGFPDRLLPGSALVGKGEMAYFPYDRTGEVDHVMAAAFLVRREVLDDVGLLDERFSIYYNDMDWCYRMKKAGWRIFYVHDATVTHHGGKTVEQVNRSFERFDELYNNVMLFYYKRYGRWGVIAYKLLMVPGFLLRSAAWTARWMVERSDRARTMMTFSLRSLATGARFWGPLPD